MPPSTNFILAAIYIHFPETALARINRNMFYIRARMFRLRLTDCQLWLFIVSHFYGFPPRLITFEF